MANENRVPTLEEFTEDWYDWEVVYENLDVNITPEEMIAINSGFSTANGISKLIKPVWNEQAKVFKIDGFKIRRSNKVSFYRGASLYEITDLKDKLSVPVKVITKDNYEDVYRNKDLFILDGTNGPIYSANEFFGMKFLNDRRILDYYVFFFYNVKGRHGHFYPVNSIGEVNTLLNISGEHKELRNYEWKTQDFELKEEDLVLKPQKKTVEDNVDKTQVVSNDHHENFLLEKAIVIFKESIFSGDVTIDAKNGLLSLANEALLLEMSSPENASADEGK